MSDLLKPGQIFAERYRIDRFLAQGGFGAVYAAEQLATELAVALKVLWPQVLASADAVEKFKLEARVAGRLNSEHIVRVVDAGFDQATRMPFLVMELLNGCDLHGIVERSGPLAPELVAQILRQVCSALDKAHGCRDKNQAPAPIVHRDLKPENLFLTHREDGSPVIKVLDFGIAKVLSAQTKASREVKGTPLFMAYEQAAGDPILPQTDIWALGLIAFFLLTGKYYWRAAESTDGSLTQLFGEVLTRPIVPPSYRIVEHGVPNAFPPAFDEWFLRCLDREPRLRFASAGEAAAEFAAAYGIAVGRSRSGSGLEPGSSPVAAAPVPQQAGRDTGPGIALAATTDASRSSPAATVPMGSRSLAGLHASQPLVDGGAANAARRKSTGGVLVTGVLAAMAIGGVAAAALFLRGRPSITGAPSATAVAAEADLAPAAPASAQAPQVAPVDTSASSSAATTATTAALATAASPEPTALASGAARAPAPIAKGRPAPKPAVAEQPPPPAPPPQRPKSDLYGER